MPDAITWTEDKLQLLAQLWQRRVILRKIGPQLGCSASAAAMALRRYKDHPAIKAALAARPIMPAGEKWLSSGRKDPIYAPKRPIIRISADAQMLAALRRSGAHRDDPTQRPGSIVHIPRPMPTWAPAASSAAIAADQGDLS